MFFVAFNKRQKRIVECLEKKIVHSSPDKMINIDDNGSPQKSPIAIGTQPTAMANVVHEFEEIDLE